MKLHLIHLIQYFFGGRGERRGCFFHLFVGLVCVLVLFKGINYMDELHVNCDITIYIYIIIIF